jgi:hypothetical protein
MRVSYKRRHLPSLAGEVPAKRGMGATVFLLIHNASPLRPLTLCVKAHFPRKRGQIPSLQTLGVAS